jgi:hypothetical protein
MCFAFAAVPLFVASLAIAETAPKAAKTYQATGPIVELTDTTIVVDKGKEGKWELARNKDTKVSGELKVGAKVTVMYTMTAASIEVKADKAPAPKTETKKK